MRNTKAEFNQFLFEQAWFAKFAPKEEADCQRLAAVAKKYFGIDMLLSQARLLWKDYSEENSAGWLILPEEDDQIARILNDFVSSYLGDPLVPVTQSEDPEVRREQANSRLKNRCQRMLRHFGNERTPVSVIEQEAILLYEALVLGYSNLLPQGGKKDGP